MSHHRHAHLSQILKNLPNRPGVYKMLGKEGEILYIGKAKSLKNRVASYFGKTIEHPKTQALVARIWDIELVVVRGETEALLLEQNLIKAHQPPYNVMLRDDKSYQYIYLSADKYPRLALGRGKGRHTPDKVFGPYPSAYKAKEILLVAQKMCQLRSCSNHEFAKRKRPCMEYQIKRCSAPCTGQITHSDYDANVRLAQDFLSGDVAAIKQSLSQKMQQHAQDLQFEQAAFYRDKLVMLNELITNQAVHKSAGEADVIAIATQAGVVCVYVLTVRGGQVLGGKTYFVDDVAIGEGIDEGLGDKLERFVLSFYREISDDVPKEIIIDRPLPQGETVAVILGGQTQLKHNVQKHRQQWLDIATLNVHNALYAKLGDYRELQQRFAALQAVLDGIACRPIDRIECFDISHTMGEAAIASCVVFDRGGVRKRDYRQYAIYDIRAGDDYAAMQQVLTRRYRKHALPDLLLIDGGKGQLNIAKQVLQDLGKLDDTLLVSVAKGEGRKAGLEVLHFINHEPIDLPSDNKALHLMMYIRDEAHRFAISNHRKKRDKARGSSVLEVIPGLGATRRRALLTHFGGISQLLGASQEDIAGVKGIGKVMAATIYKALHD